MDADEPVSPASLELLDELPASPSTKYEAVETIAIGGYAEVLKVYLRENKHMGHFALKRTRHDSIRGLITQIDFCEVRSLKLLQNEANIVKMIDIVKDVCEYGIVLELCKADLRMVLYKNDLKLSLPDIKNMLKQMFTGIEAIHRFRIMHRDLKPANILLSNTGILKISDFGSSTMLERRSHFSVNICTLWYKSPELLFRHNKYDEKTDLWSAGVTAAEFWLRDVMFKGEDENDQMKKISKVCGFCSNQIWPGANEFPQFELFSEAFGRYKENKLDARLKKFIKDDSAVAFVAKFLKLYPGDRMTAEEALQDPFFTTGPEPSFDLYQVINRI